MVEPDTGRFYELRRRLSASLSHHQLAPGKPFSPIQEDTRMLLGEVEHMASLLQKVERDLALETNPELARQVRRAVLMHFPAQP